MICPEIYVLIENISFYCAMMEDNVGTMLHKLRAWC